MNRGRYRKSGGVLRVYSAPKFHVQDLMAIFFIGAINFFGPKHSGSLAFMLAVPTVIVVVVLAAAFLVWGGYAVRDVPLDVLPDLSAPTVTVLVEGHAMAPTEMESLVTFPIEAALNGASGVRRVRSATAIGLTGSYERSPAMATDVGSERTRMRSTSSEAFRLAWRIRPITSVSRPSSLRMAECPRRISQ